MLLFSPTCFNHLDVCVLRPVLIVLLSKAEVQGEKYYKVYVNIMQLLVVSSFFFLMFFILLSSCRSYVLCEVQFE